MKFKDYYEIMGVSKSTGWRDLKDLMKKGLLRVSGRGKGSVYALDQETGCTRWHYKAVTEVRSAVTIDFEEGGALAEWTRTPSFDLDALIRATGNVLASRFARAEQTGALEDNVYAELAPRQLGGIALGEDDVHGTELRLHPPGRGGGRGPPDHQRRGGAHRRHLRGGLSP